MLESGDRTVGVGEGGLEMGEDLCGCGPTVGSGRQVGRRAASQQGRADGTLSPVESRPDALEGSVAPRAVGGTDGGGDTAGNGVLEERPQGAGGQAQPPDFVGDPDAKSPSAAGSPMTVAAEDPPSPDDFLRGIAVVKSVEEAVPDERADRLAMGTDRLFEPLGHRDPLLLVAIEPLLVGHVRLMLPGSH